MQTKVINYPAEIIVIRHGESTQNIHARQKIALPKLVDIAYSVFGKAGAYRLTLLLDWWRGKKTYSGVPDQEVPLSALGTIQARLTGNRLWDHQLIPNVILASAYTRAIQTAQILQEELFATTGKTIPIHTHYFLKEKMEGSLDGIPRDYLKHLYPLEAKNYYKAGKFTYRATAGENVLDVDKRVAENFWKTLQPYAGQSVMLIAHGITNTCIHSLLSQENLQENIEQGWQIMPNLAISRYYLAENNRWQNDSHYLKKTII